MAMMAVYHGGYQAVEEPEIRIGRNTKDFGTEFYFYPLSARRLRPLRDATFSVASYRWERMSQIFAFIFNGIERSVYKIISLAKIQPK